MYCSTGLWYQNSVPDELHFCILLILVTMHHLSKDISEKKIHCGGELCLNSELLWEQDTQHL